MNSIEIKSCAGVDGNKVIAKGNPALFALGVIVGVVGTLYLINTLSGKQTETLASTATDVISLLRVA